MNRNNDSSEWVKHEQRQTHGMTRGKARLGGGVYGEWMMGRA